MNVASRDITNIYIVLLPNLLFVVFSFWMFARINLYLVQNSVLSFLYFREDSTDYCLPIRFFFSVCSNNYYGSNCSTTCGHCYNDDVCNNVTGHCPNGCQNQWTGDRCDGKFEDLQWSTDSWRVASHRCKTLWSV